MHNLDKNIQSCYNTGLSLYFLLILFKFSLKPPPTPFLSRHKVGINFRRGQRGRPRLTQGCMNALGRAWLHHFLPWVRMHDVPRRQTGLSPKKVGVHDKHGDLLGDGLVFDSLSPLTNLLEHLL